MIELIYKPRGEIKKLWTDSDPYIVAEGPANTGKSRAIAEWVYGMAEQWPMSRHLVAKLTRKSLTESIIPTFENHVFPPGHPALEGAGRNNRHSYEFPNGSVIVLGGLDDPTKRYSEEWDTIWVNEATQIPYDTYQQFFRGLRNKRILHPDGNATDSYRRKDGSIDADLVVEHFKAGVFVKFRNQWPDGSPIFFHRLVLDTNPDVPGHWINVLANEGRLTRIVTRHKDNPTFTPQDQQTLDELTGVRRLRLRDGKWCAAEGQVWEAFDPFVHVVQDVPRDSFGQPAFKMWVASQDWGFRAPGCFQLWGVTENGDMYLFVEIYMSERAIDWWLREAKETVATIPVVAVVCDSEDPASIDLYRRTGLPAKEADKHSKRTSLDQVRDRLAESVRAHGIGERRGGGIYFLASALKERDPKLKAAHQPCCTIEEIPGYVLRELKPTRGIDDETDPRCPDHGCDAMRYAVRFVDAYHPSRAIRRSDAQDSAEATRGSDVPDELLILERGTARDDGGSGIRWPWSTT